MKKKRQPRTPEVCPVCDEDVPPNAKACPHCGACHESGWKDASDDEDSDEIDWDIVDLPDEVLDEEERREKHARLAKKGVPAKWWWVALGLVVMWLAYFLYTLGYLW